MTAAPSKVYQGRSTCTFNLMNAGYNIIKNITYVCNSIVVVICDD